MPAEQTDQPLANRREFRFEESSWDEFVAALDRPARSLPNLARLLSSDSVFDD